MVVDKKDKLPSTKHFAALRYRSVTQNGYDPGETYQLQIVEYIAFKDENAMADYVREQTQSISPDIYSIIEATPKPPKVTINVEI